MRSGRLSGAGSARKDSGVMSFTGGQLATKSIDGEERRAGVVHDLFPPESLGARGRRLILGLAWAMRPRRIAGVPATLAMVAAHYLERLGYGSLEEALPDPETALRRPDGLAGICTSLDPRTLMRAYAKGLYPWCHVGPMKWWAPRERMVLFFERFHIEKNLRRRLRNHHFRVTFDHDFAAVMRGCAEPRPGRPHLTWITPPVMRAFQDLHELGHAHSVEVWDDEGELAGGLYGLAVGGVFFTESQFVRKRDASKVGFATLNCHLQRWGFALDDGKSPTAHLSQLGFELIPRARFNAILAEHCAREVKVGRWRVDPALDVGAWDPAAPGWAHQAAGA